MNNTKIKLMSVDDIEGVMIVENLSFEIPWSKDAFFQEITKNEFAVYYVALVSDVIVGYAGFWKICDEGHITNVAVHPDYRRNGIAKKLVTKLINYAKKNEIEKMTLEVRTGNTAAIELYSKFGFKPGGLRKEYYEDNLEDALIMWKDDVQQ